MKSEGSCSDWNHDNVARKIYGFPSPYDALNMCMYDLNMYREWFESGLDTDKLLSTYLPFVYGYEFIGLSGLLKEREMLFCKEVLPIISQEISAALISSSPKA